MVKTAAATNAGLKEALEGLVATLVNTKEGK
jgi:hypothetical protein